MNGFTALELLVYIGVLTIVLGSITFFTINIIQNERTLSDRARTTDELDFAMRQIIDQTRGAKSIRPIPQSDFAAGGNTSKLALEKSGIGGSTTVVFSVVINGDDAYLKMDDGSVVSRLTSPSVYADQFSLKCVSADSPCASEPQAVQVTLGLRNLKTQEVIKITTGAMPRGF